MKHIEKIKLADIAQLSIVTAAGRTMAQVKAAVGCDYILNGGLYDMTTGKPVGHLKVAGKVLAKETWGSWGYAWTTGPDIAMKSIPDNAGEYANYITCLPLLTPWDNISAPLTYPAALGGKRGRTVLAVTSDSLVLYCSKDGTADGATPEKLRQELYDMGAVTALMLDSGGSSQCDFGGGRTIYSARRVHNYICIWTKKEDEKMPNKKFTVCIDPGHGPLTLNGSPDGIYLEREFAWDMGQRLKRSLEEQGIATVLTRTEDVKPSLTDRAYVSNKAGADLFVSIHSNAYGSGGWTDPNGLVIYTSLPGENAGRNKAAKAILQRMREAMVNLHGSGLAHNGYTVLVETTAPAVLIEYGFHTNQDDVQHLKTPSYRDTLATATAHGICDYLGVEWVPVTNPEAPADKPTAPWYAETQQWAKEMGLTDGTRPEEACTRAEVWEMLRRYDALKGGK